MSDLKELLERVKNATGPDRGIDECIHVATNPPLREGLRFGNIPHYTASLDAIVALIEAKLPGWWLHGLGKSPLHGLWWAQLYSLDRKEGAESDELHSACLALCAAFLSALTKENAHGK